MSINLVFVLVMVMGRGGINTDLTFPTLQQCEAVAATAIHHGVDKAFCIEQQVKKRKLNCKIENRTDYTNSRTTYNHNMEHYPYPVGFNCIEE